MPKTIEDRRRFLHEVAEALAPTWERQRPFIEEVCTPVREWMLRELAPKAGDTVLELAAGVGDTGFEAAAIVGDMGRVISSDFSPKMVEAARRRATELGVRNVEYRVIDAERIELDDDSVDGVLCRFGFMLMTDPEAALAETRRVLRPGGRLSLAVWGDPQRNPFLTSIATILIERGHLPPPESDEPSPFSMAADERIVALLEDAGFGDARVEELAVRANFVDIQQYLQFAADTAGPLGLTVQELSEPEREAVSAGLEVALGPFSTNAGYEIPGVAVGAVAS